MMSSSTESSVATEPTRGATEAKIKMVKVNINGKDFEAREGSTVLEVARDNDITIPTLCYHPELTPTGYCRLCLVELIKDSRTKVVQSCVSRVEPGLVVKTETGRVKADRKVAMQRLLTSYPGSVVLHDLGKKLGVESPEVPVDKTPCILCGLCIKVCKEVVGVNALEFSRSGGKREVVASKDPSRACIACGSCVYICPTRYIRMEDKDGYRILPTWGVKTKLVDCSKCDLPFTTERQLEDIRNRLKLPPGSLTVCPSCK